MCPSDDIGSCWREISTCRRRWIRLFSNSKKADVMDMNPMMADVNTFVAAGPKQLFHCVSCMSVGGRARGIYRRFSFRRIHFFFPTFTIFSFLKSRPIWIGHSNSFIRSGYFGNGTTAAPQPQAADRRTNGHGRWRSVSRKVTQGVLPRATKKHGPQLRDCYAQSSVAFRTLSCYVACLVRRRVS